MIVLLVPVVVVVVVVVAVTGLIFRGLANGASVFEVVAAPAEYPSVAYWVSGPVRKFLLWPLNEMVDEHYTVYWDLHR